MHPRPLPCEMEHAEGRALVDLEAADVGETRVEERFRPGQDRSVDELKRRGVIAAVPKSGIVVRRAASRKIGLIVPGVAVTDFFKPVVSEINRLARNAGYELRFGEVWSDVREERIAQVRELAAEFIKGKLAGVIYEPLAGPIGDEINPHILELFDKKGIPVVLIDCDIVPFPTEATMTLLV